MHIKHIFPNSMRSLPCREQGGRVVVVTRTKDRPLLLARAFASILNQTYQDWHLYLVNDGGDPLPVEKLLQRHVNAFNGRVTVKHHPISLGMEAASNAALEEAVGDFVAIHDDDDAWDPSFLEETTAFLSEPENAAYVAVVTNCTVIHERLDGNSTIEERREAWGSWSDRIDMSDLLIRNTFPPISLVVRKAAVDSLGAFNPQMAVLGDWDFNLRLLTLGDIGTIRSSLAYHCHRRRSQTNRAYGNSTVDGISQHIDYNILYRNGLLREFLSKEPGNLGLIQAILSTIRNSEQTVLDRIGHLQWAIHQIEQRQIQHEATFGAINQLLRPLRWVWRRIIPFRRFVARCRGRIR